MANLVVRFVRDQPDAYIYSSFGTRIFIAGFLLALLYIGQGILVYTSTDKVLSLSSLIGRDSGGDIMGQLVGGLILVTAVFVPLASSTMAISRWVLKRTATSPLGYPLRLSNKVSTQTFLLYSNISIRLKHFCSTQTFYSTQAFLC